MTTGEPGSGAPSVGPVTTPAAAPLFLSAEFPSAEPDRAVESVAAAGSTPTPERPAGTEPADADTRPEPILLLEPRDGLSAVVETPEALAETQRALAAGSGPVALDAERASGYRYGQRAYLVQLRRPGVGTFLIDPIAVGDLSGVQTAIESAEWVFHAASQDLPCLAEVGLHPGRLFDTELAARLAGFERVGLGSIVENVLGYRLEKGHSAADWSTRPLPESWLRYAALDVELLVELRDALEAELVAQGKLAWAHQEFAALVAATPKPVPADPWRRTSGIHRLRSRRQLGAVRSLWLARDRMARRRDIAPGRILPDKAIVEAALVEPANADELVRLPVFSGPRMRRNVDVWWQALAEAAQLPDAELPRPASSGGPGSAAGAGLPPANRWAERDPDAASRLARARLALNEVAARYRLPVENLLEPAAVRRLSWSPPEKLDAVTIADVLLTDGARAWQVELTAEPLAAGLAAEPPAMQAEAAEEPGETN